MYREWSLFLFSLPSDGSDLDLSARSLTCQNARIRQLCVARKIAYDVRNRQWTFGTIARQESDRAEPVIFILSVRFNLILPVHTKGRLISTVQNSSRELAIHRLSRLNAAVMSLHRTTDYATVLLSLPGISNDLEVVRLL